jgi:hypothetical protein
MKSILLTLLLVVSAKATDIQVYFSPKGGCTEAVVSSLIEAKSNVLVQAYSFTSAPIAKALVDAESGESWCKSFWTKASEPKNITKPIFSCTRACRLGLTASTPSRTTR